MIAHGDIDEVVAAEEVEEFVGYEARERVGHAFDAGEEFGVFDGRAEEPGCGEPCGEVAVVEWGEEGFLLAESAGEDQAGASFSGHDGCGDEKREFEGVADGGDEGVGGGRGKGVWGGDGGDGGGGGDESVGGFGAEVCRDVEGGGGEGGVVGWGVAEGGGGDEAAVWKGLKEDGAVHFESGGGGGEGESGDVGWGHVGADGALEV